MHGLDSNVLLRFVLEDEPAQYELARRFFGRCTRENPAYVNLMVLCEFVWVLTTGARRREPKSLR
jgi:predicted nucleic-acid-binding protein